MTKPKTVVRGSPEHERLVAELLSEDVKHVCEFLRLPEAQGKADQVLAMLGRNYSTTLAEARVLLAKAPLDPAVPPAAPGTLAQSMAKILGGNVIAGPGAPLPNGRDH